MSEKARPLAQDRKYLESRIASGFEIYLNGKTYNQINAHELPSQAELDGEEKSSTGFRPRSQAAGDKAAAEKAPAEKAAAEKAAAEKAAAEKKAASK